MAFINISQIFSHSLPLYAFFIFILKKLRLKNTHTFTQKNRIKEIHLVFSLISLNSKKLDSTIGDKKASERYNKN